MPLRVLRPFNQKALNMLNISLSKYFRGIDGTGSNIRTFQYRTSIN